MQSYLNMLRDILDNGTAKHPTRAESGATANPTIGLPSVHFTHDLSTGFPLLTTRRLPCRNIVGELRSFLEGRTAQAEFAANGCNVFWDAWSNNLSDRGVLDRHGNPFQPGALGYVYGSQWRDFGGTGYDQVQHVLDCLRDRPTDRRMVVSAWNPPEHGMMALPPCHVMWIVTPYNGRLNLSWFQRSCDFPIGVPCNIASYALLCHILAKWAGMKPGKIDCIFCDSHIYENQLEGVAEQLARTPDALPSVEVRFHLDNDFHSWDVAFEGYDPQPAISFGAVEV